MEGYATIAVVCDECIIYPRILKKFIMAGRIRVKHTKNIKTGRPVRWVHLQDTKDVLEEKDLDFIGINLAAEQSGVTPKAIRNLIKFGRFRWRREGRSLAVCLGDLEAFFDGSDKKRASL